MTRSALGADDIYANQMSACPWCGLLFLHVGFAILHMTVCEWRREEPNDPA